MLSLTVHVGLTGVTMPSAHQRQGWKTDMVKGEKERGRRKDEGLEWSDLTREATELVRAEEQRGF